MKKITFLRNLIVLVALLIGSGSAMGQTTLITNDCSTATAGWTFTNNVTGQPIQQTSGGGYWLLQASSSSTKDEIITPALDVTNYTNLTLTFKVATYGSGTNNPAQVDYSLDGGTTWSATKFTSATPTSSTYINSGSINLGTLNTTTLKIRFVNAGIADKGVRMDDILLVGTFAPSCTASNLAFDSPTTVEKLADDVNFIKTATSLNETTAIVYNSSDTGVATVNSSTGEVDILSAGTTTITATQAAGTHNSVDYCASEATYTLNVAPIDPTITVTEETVPAMSIAVGGTDTEIITVNASNLTGDITLAVTGANESLFTLSTYTLAHSSGSVSNQSVTITYTPDAPAASHTATLTLSSPGAESVVKNLSGSASLAKPTAADATGISPSGFTANWDAVPGAVSYELDVYKKQGEISTALFISEYIEGSGNNKAIEVFNGTGASIDLTGYNLKVYANGATTPGSAINLSGTLADQSVYVVANTGANASILAKADMTSGSLTHNGNDAVGLFNGTTLIDVVGPIGDASNWGIDMTLIRKSSVTSPVTTYDVNEWTQQSNDYILDLGSHSTITITPVSDSPFAVTGETSKAITGLTASTQYFYTVKALNGEFLSVVSDEVSVTTSFGTSTDNPTLTNIYAYNAKIHFAATAGEKVEVYNAVGQKIISTLATDGQNELTVNGKGVMIVKVGSRLAKVIL
ncbi:hypothetical protein SDC9_37062 [bioreactor metagenome]|uniref:LTD domain-containing protein n=1 Tax=bioreactor metagenome TaxID=1076179 RepID=A0A644VK84_9ZZZZ|nr:lamin tail domain-containing protein [Paludibacter sp.]